MSRDIRELAVPCRTPFVINIFTSAATSELAYGLLACDSGSEARSRLGSRERLSAIMLMGCEVGLHIQASRMTEVPCWSGSSPHQRAVHVFHDPLR
jgi:hypothetical protein